MKVYLLSTSGLAMFKPGKVLCIAKKEFDLEPLLVIEIDLSRIQSKIS